MWPKSQTFLPGVIFFEPRPKWFFMWKQISALGNKVIAVFFLLCQQRYQWLIGDAFNMIGVFYFPLPDVEERPRVVTSWKVTRNILETHLHYCIKKNIQCIILPAYLIRLRWICLLGLRRKFLFHNYKENPVLFKVVCLFVCLFKCLQHQVFLDGLQSKY